MPTKLVVTENNEQKQKEAPKSAPAKAPTPVASSIMDLMGGDDAGGFDEAALAAIKESAAEKEATPKKGGKGKKKDDAPAEQTTTTVTAAPDATLSITPAAVEVPATKSAVTSMTTPELDALVEQQGYQIPKWDQLSVQDKKKAMVAFLFPDDATPAQKKLLNDPIQQVSSDIENLDDQWEIEKEISSVQSSQGISGFKLGGLLQRLNLKGAFDEGVTFKAYIDDKFGVRYRKAMQLVSNYNGIINSNVAWSDIEDLGWTKVAIILKVITPENVKEWVAKAKSVNNPTLRKMVDEAMAPADGATAPEAKNYTTKTFQLHEDQVEIVEAAIEDAMKKGGTEHKGTALEWVCTGYLAEADSNKVNPAQYASLKKTHDETLERVSALSDALAAANLQIEELKAGGAGAASIRDVFEYAKQEYGSVKKALEALFGDVFEASFPGIICELSNVPPDAEEASEAEQAAQVVTPAPKKKKAA